MSDRDLARRRVGRSRRRPRSPRNEDARPALCGRLVLVVLLVGSSLIAAGQVLPKLPADLTLPKSADSPGTVVFSHATHVGMQARPDCTACHPRLAPILKPARGVTRAPITHATMEKGRSCGACHNGKQAVGLDDCTHCHKAP